MINLFKKALTKSYPKKLFTLREPSKNSFQNLHFSYPHPRLVICTAGTARFKISQMGDEATLILKTGDAVFIAASAYFYSLNDAPYTTIGVLMRESHSDIFINDQEHQHHHRQMERRKHCPKLIPVWFKQLSSTSHSQQLLLAQLILDQTCQMLETESGPIGSRGRLEQILAYLHKHYHLSITNKGLAEKFDLHPNYINKLFHTFKGMSYSSYLKSLRLSLAKELLLNSNMPIEQIATSCGYHHPSYLSRQFKTEYLLTPLQFRKRMV